MAKDKTNKERVVELLADGNSRTPKEIASALEMKPNQARGLLVQMMHEGLISKVRYGVYGASPQAAHTPTHQGIKPQEGSPVTIGKTTYIQDSQSSTTLDGDVGENNRATSNPTTLQEVPDMELPTGGLSTVRIPEYVEVIMFNQVVARVKMSTVVPGLVHRIDMTENIFKSSGIGVPQKQEPPTSES